MLSVLLSVTLAWFASATPAAALQAPDPAATQAAAGPMRPANVPASYVITPFGYPHPSCVQSLARGEHLLAAGRRQHATGAVDIKAASCSRPRFTRNGMVATAPSTAASAEPPPLINGWVASANITTGSPSAAYAGIVAVWTVPPAPLVNDNQVIYFVPGLEDFYSDQSILQPVLGWWQGTWTIASWNCCLNGVATNSAPVTVKPGDKIYGSVTNNCRWAR